MYVQNWSSTDRPSSDKHFQMVKVETAYNQTVKRTQNQEIHNIAFMGLHTGSLFIQSPSLKLSILSHTPLHLSSTAIFPACYYIGSFLHKLTSHPKYSWKEWDFEYSSISYASQHRPWYSLDSFRIRNQAS